MFLFFLPPLYFHFIIIIIIYSLEFFTSALADGLSLEFEWQQIFFIIIIIIVLVVVVFVVKMFFQ